MSFKANLHKEGESSRHEVSLLRCREHSGTRLVQVRMMVPKEDGEREGSLATDPGHVGPMAAEEQDETADNLILHKRVREQSSSAKLAHMGTPLGKNVKTC